jgi:CheY-like chemotaxis protein
VRSPGGGEDRLLLRAEVAIGDEATVAHTIEVTSAHVIIQMERWPPIGTHVQVRLSFPRLLAPLSLAGRVVRHHAPLAPGDVAGVTVELDHDTSAAASSADLAALLARVHASFDDEAEEAPARLPAPPCYRILLVEDNVTIRQLFVYGVSKYFHRHACEAQVDLADDGEQGWNLLCARPYDLAIVDCYLPVLDGASLVERMRAIGVGEGGLPGTSRERLPIVGISAGGDEARRMMVTAGVDLFLAKPIVLRDLFSTLERLMVRPRPTRAGAACEGLL